MKKQLTATLLLISLFCRAQYLNNNPQAHHGNKFEQLGTILPTPNEYRTASGAPGPAYWQQRADYDIKCTLDEKNLRLSGSEIISYFNNSPDALRYLWLQLDENQNSSIDNSKYDLSSGIPPQVSRGQINKWEQALTDNGYGDKITLLQDANGKNLHYVINKTMMRVDLPAPLKHGQRFSLHIEWNYRIPNRMVLFGRGGYEQFAADGNSIFTMTQFYPRLCVYNDFRGWQNQQTDTKEFALGFGNFKVQITVPADHIVGATGQCQNYHEMMSAAQWSRWQKAQITTTPIDLVTLEEAKAAEKTIAPRTKTWMFKADSVRDFAWTTSRKFIWDAMPTTIAGKKIMCMSYYGKEAYGLYHPFSTKLVAHTLKIYSAHLIPYPYPVAQSVEASNGMEYPMICFNYGRTDTAGKYTDSVKYGMQSVVIHEVGHNFFPMIINNDERQWSWMDEGFNSFFEYLAEKAWDSSFPSRRGPAEKVVSYMAQPRNQLEPIMTNANNILQFGPNVYTKTSSALNILRETVIGKELFDDGFREFARRWAFKHPTPADFFRTMEDVGAEDLDWFWRGWFFSTDHCDVAIDSVRTFRTDSSNKYFYQVNLSNKGGLVMPVILRWTFADGATEDDRVAAQIWRLDEEHMSKVFIKSRKVVHLQLDPMKETADTDTGNNSWSDFSRVMSFKISE